MLGVASSFCKKKTNRESDVVEHQWEISAYSKWVVSWRPLLWNKYTQLSNFVYHCNDLHVISFDDGLPGDSVSRGTSINHVTVLSLSASSRHTCPYRSRTNTCLNQTIAKEDGFDSLTERQVKRQRKRKRNFPPDEPTSLSQSGIPLCTPQTRHLLSRL